MKNKKSNLSFLLKRLGVLRWVMTFIGSNYRKETTDCLARIGLTLLTALLLVLSFYPADQGWLAWFALVPLIMACSGCRLKGHILLGILAGSVATVGIFFWIFELSAFRWYHGLLLASLFGLFPSFWCAGIYWAPKWRLPVILSIPALWVGLDFLKANMGFLSLPWATLAHSQHHNLALIQLASVTGEYGVTFIIVLANTAIAAVLLERKWSGLAIVMMAVLSVHAWGAVQLSGHGDGQQLKVAVVQPNIARHERETAYDRALSYKRLEQLTLSSAGKGLDLAVWPETAVRDLRRHTVLLEQIRNISRKIGAPIITGSSDFKKFSLKNSRDHEHTAFQTKVFNSAYFVSATGPLSTPYRKRIRVPFGEYRPLEDTLDWPQWLAPETLSVMPGKQYRLFSLPGGLRVSPIICWENIFSGYVRRLARQAPHLIVQLTNDNWFGNTAAPHQHNVASVFRAVENRIPVAVASNSGPSQVIDAYGRVVARDTKLFSQGVAEANVRPGRGIALYTRHGDLFAWACSLIFLPGVIVYALEALRLGTPKERGAVKGAVGSASRNVPHNTH